jgi:hypothetical protein
MTEVLLRIGTFVAGALITIATLAYLFSGLKPHCTSDGNGVLSAACYSHPGLPDPGHYGPEQYGNPDGVNWRTGSP